LNNSYLDYKVFVVSDTSKINEKLSGDNGKYILIVTSEDDDAEMVTFLEKILTAVKIQLQTDCLILRGMDSSDFPSFSDIVKNHKIDKALVFGFKASDLGLVFQTPQYFITEILDYKFLFVDNLSIIFKQVEKKKALWDNLQLLFQ
jgi:hypothetical protein